MRLVLIASVVSVLAGGVLIYYLAQNLCKCMGSSSLRNLEGVNSAPELRAHVQALAGRIGERNVFLPGTLLASANYIAEKWRSYGYGVKTHDYKANGETVSNLIVEKVGKLRPEEIILIGAHYDSVQGSPGANDNGSGTAALLVLSKLMKPIEYSRTLRFVAFVNEEPPFFWTSEMGSRAYVEEIVRGKEKVVAMISLETMGYFSDSAGSQSYPFPFKYLYPTIGNFVAFVGNVQSRKLVDRVVQTFRSYSEIQAECVKGFSFIEGVGWSDHESFWRKGIPALMITDTAPFRYPYYHTREDLPDKLDYQRFDKTVAALKPVIEDLLQGE